MLPESINTIRLEGCRERLGEWYRSVPVHVSAPDTPPVLEVKNVSFAYASGGEVLHDVSFTVHEGEMLEHRGQERCGKIHHEQADLRV